MNSLPDYYQILNVRREAGQAEIVSAYRQQAMRCHPDHGGSHEDMIRLNEAWAILRDPASRRAYDEWLSRQGAQSTAITIAVQRARSTADEYPRRWDDFEKWMEGFLDDFTRAEYGQTERGLPTAKNSISGSGFIFAGGAVGAVLMVVVSPIILSIPTLWGGEPKAIIPGAMLIMLFVGAGCWVGAYLHRMIGSGIKTVRPSSFPKANSSSSQPRNTNPPPIPKAEPEPIRKIKITCPHCSQRIEAPTDVIGSVVTCPTCNKDFHVGKRTPQAPPIPYQQSRHSQEPPPIPQQPPPIP